MKIIVRNVFIETLKFPLCVKNNILKIKTIRTNKKEIENIGYMFRENCFEILINSNDKNIILSNYQ